MDRSVQEMDVRLFRDGNSLAGLRDFPRKGEKNFGVFKYRKFNHMILKE